MTLTDTIFEGSPFGTVAEMRAEKESPYVDATVPPPSRRLKPSVIQDVMLALRAGVGHRTIADAYGISQTSVSRIAAKMGDAEFQDSVADLQELESAEAELRASGLPKGQIENIIEWARVGHLMRRARERRAR